MSLAHQARVSERLNLGELRSSGVLFYAREAAAILYEVASQLNDAEEMGNRLQPPGLEQIEITHDGELVWSVPSGSTSDPMPALASLIEQVLPPTLRDQPDYAIPSSFRVLAPRCRGWPPGLPPIETPGDLAAAINRYRSGDNTVVLQALFERLAGSRRADQLATASGSVPAMAPADLEHEDTVAHDTNAVADRDIAHPTLDPAFTDEYEEVDIEDLPLLGAPSFPHDEARPSLEEPEPRDAQPARTRYARLIAVPALLVLFAFGASYEITRWMTARNERTVHADEGHQPSDATREKGPSVPTPETEPAPVPTHDPPRRSDLPISSLSTAPLEMPQSLGPAFSPSFASSGASLVFHVGRDPSARVMMADLQTDATTVKVVPIVDDLARNYHPRLSPDGRYLAFDSDRDGVRGVYVADRDGTGSHRVSGSGFAAVPTWSPDMHWIAFVRGESTRPKVWNLWLHEIATGMERQLTDYRYGQTWAASWFSDSRRLCYSHEDQLVILDLDNGRDRLVRSPIPGHLVRTPAVSPDGQRIVFQVSRSGVWLLDVPTNTMRRIMDDLSAEEFAWSPDARHVAYHSHRSGKWQIWLATVPTHR